MMPDLWEWSQFIEYGNETFQSLKDSANMKNVIKYIKEWKVWTYFQDKEIEVPVSPDEELLMTLIFFLFFTFAAFATYVSYSSPNGQLDQKETFFWIVMNRLKLGITKLSQMIYELGLL